LGTNLLENDAYYPIAAKTRLLGMGQVHPWVGSGRAIIFLWSRGSGQVNICNS